MHWVYHPSQEAKIVFESEYKELLKDGWYDTPAAFPVIESIETDVPCKTISSTEETVAPKKKKSKSNLNK